VSQNVHVEPALDGWAVKEGSKPAQSFQTKAEAVKVGRRLAQANRSEHFVHRRDGRIEERDSYGRDPFPPR
jgi:hypothetical protein